MQYKTIEKLIDIMFKDLETLNRADLLKQLIVEKIGFDLINIKHYLRR